MCYRKRLLSWVLAAFGVGLLLGRLLSGNILPILAGIGCLVWGIVSLNHF